MEASTLDAPVPVMCRPRGVVHAVRRSVDVLIALVVLTLLAPLMLAVALAVRLDSPGSALFAQERVGRGMRRFRCLKFRTMTSRCDTALHRDYVRELIAGDDAAPGHTGLYKLGQDPRVTRVGRVLRRTSLDELPQLFNVVLGHMALVGPRPVIPYEAELYPPDFLARFAVRPGLTGLWQVSGRNERSYQEMIDLDLRYAADNSLGGDLMILLKTVPVLLKRRGVA